MRSALLLSTVVAALAGCLDFSVAPGTLACDTDLDQPCPKDWLCLLEASADAYGRCYPPGAPPEGDQRLVGPRAAPAATPPGQRYFVDPATGSAGNPGTEEAPWRTLAEVVSSGKIERRAADGTLTAAGVVRPGDTLVLRDGDHGKVDLSGYFNPQKVYVLAADGAQPRLAGLTIHTGAGWWIQGLTIEASGCGNGAGIVSVGESGTTATASAVELVGNTLRSTKDASSWSDSDWKSTACTGIHLVNVTDVRAAFNELRHVRDGIRINGKRITLERNLIDGFSAKAIPIAGAGVRGVKIRGNLASNAYHLANESQTLIHGSGCDGCGDFEISRNRLLAYRGGWVPAEHRNATQGIGLFDGPYDKIDIVNNLVICNHWNGISVLQASDVRVINNTTVMAVPTVGGPDRSWIQVTGTLGSVIVRNNLANEIDVGVGATVDHNGVVGDPAAYFVDPGAGDYRPSADSPALDSGSEDRAPADDLFGRPRDGQPDLGAIER